MLADDHPVVRAGLREILQRHGTIEVVGEAGDGAALIAVIKSTSPEVAVLDISMPNLNGIDAAATIRSRHPGTRVLLLSVHCNEETITDAIEAGVKGYVLKDAAEEELVRAVHAVAQSQGYFSPAVAGLIASSVAEHRAGSRPRLSARERSVVQLISEGLPPRIIAARLFVSPQTVKSHRTNAMRKLGVRTTADLIRYALRHGLSSNEPFQN